MSWFNLLPEYPHFRPILLADKRDYEEFLGEHFAGDLSFSNLFNWRINNDRTKISRLNNDLLINSCDLSENKQLTWIISHHNPNKTIKEILKFESPIVIPETLIESVNQSNYCITPDLNNFEYVVKVDDLLMHKGSNLRNFRIDLKKFEDKYDSTLDFVTTRMKWDKSKLYSEIEFLFEKWRKYKKIKKEISSSEKSALTRLLKHSNLYDLWLLKAVRKNDGHLISFGTIEIFPENNIAIIGFLKTDYSFDGISSRMVLEIAGLCKSLGIEYINYEQDLGIASLRKFKQKLNPVKYIKKYLVSRNDEAIGQ